MRPLRRPAPIRSLTLGAIAVVVATACGGGSSTSEPTTATTTGVTTTSWPGPERLVADWPMTDAAGGAMADASGNGHIGAVGTAVQATGSSFVFPSAVPGEVDPARLVEVTSAPDLDAVPDPFSVSVRVRTSSAGEHNVVQKGQSGAAGGFWKIEINANGQTPGIPHCTFKGPNGAGAISTDVRIDDGEWHTVVCRWSATTVAIHVDDVRREEPADTGPIANTDPLTIGGKARCNPDGGVECDYFVGELTDLRIGNG